MLAAVAPVESLRPQGTDACPGLNPGERLVQAASQLMHERGYEAVGVAELCLAADVRKGSFYHWWPSKAALTEAMLDRSWGWARAQLFDPAFATGLPTLDAFARYGELLTTHLRDGVESGDCGVQGCQFGNLAAEMSTRDPAIRRRVAAVFADMAAIFATAIAAGIERGELAADLDPTGAADAVLAHVQGLMVLAKARNDPALLGRLGDDTARLLTR